MEHRIQTFRKSADEFPASCFFRRTDDLFISCIRLSKTDVVSHGSALDPGILQYHAKAASERMSGYFPDVFSIHQDLSFIYVIETHQQVNKCRLTASGRTNDCDTHTWFYIQIEILNQFFFFIITECHIINCNIAIDCSKYSFCIRCLFFLLQQVKDTVRTCQRILHLCNYRTDIIERLHILVRIR